jgi:hypothetical protein
MFDELLGDRRATLWRPGPGRERSAPARQPSD